MNTDLSKIPCTGVKRALFFNRLHAIGLESRLKRSIPEEVTIYRSKEAMERAIREAGLAEDTVIPESVPFFQPESEYGPMRPASSFVMVITDREPEQFLSAISGFSKERDGYSGLESVYGGNAPCRDIAKHTGCSKVQLMDHLLKETMSFYTYMPLECSNAFASEESARFDIIDGLYQAAEEIAAWRCGTHRYTRRNEWLVLYIPLWDEGDLGCLGEGEHEYLQGNAFRQTEDDISLTHSTHLCLVLAPCDIRDGFRLISAYPLSQFSVLDQVQDDTLDIIRQTKAYREASPYWKAVFEYKGAIKPDDRPYICAAEGKTDAENRINILCPQGKCLTVHTDGSIEYCGGDTRIPVTGDNEAEYTAMFPKEMRVAAWFSKRIKELTAI